MQEDQLGDYLNKIIKTEIKTEVGTKEHHEALTFDSICQLDTCWTEY